VKSGVCPKCAGKLEVAGKGLVKCPYCGSEVFSN
jgi:DNA-directed RNA polymerase subunit RPC12/RpoP